jgi:DNA polymerase III delta prime subunit
LLDALHSRSAVIDFSLRSDEKPELASAFMKRIEYILTEEGIVYDKQAVIKLIQKFFPDYRRVLNELQRYSKSGSIDAGIIAQISDIRKLSDLIGYLKVKDFSAMRKWVALNSDIEPNHIYRAIYDGLYDYFKPESIPQAVVILGKYQYQSAFVASQEINLCAAMTELMVDCEIK